MILINSVDNYESKTAKVFKLINHYRCYPRSLAKHLEKVKTYFNKSTNILAEPNKIQFQMIEGEEVFNEAIGFLQQMLPKKPFEWNEYLAMSAQEHVNDIGQKGLLLYQSSDGTEPQDRIGRYGKYVETLGENIDFGPNDALGIIVSFTLDDGEPNRPHRNNLFKNNYEKIGIAIGHHKTEFQMCVIDFAFDFTPHPKRIEQPLKYSFNSLSDIPQSKKEKSQKHINKKQQVKSCLQNQSKDKVNNDYNAKNKAKDCLKSSKENSPKKGHLRSSSQASKCSMLTNPLSLSEKEELNTMKRTAKGAFKTLSTIEHQDHMCEISNVSNKKKITKKSVEVTTITTYAYDDETTKEIQEKIRHEYRY